MQKKYVADYLCWGKILVDLKALDRLTGKGQILNYRKGTQLKVGLIINFGSVGRLDGKRFVR